MCIKTPKMPEIRQAPTRTEASKSSLAEDMRRRAAAAGGIFSNIFTSALGDRAFGSSTRSRSSTGSGTAASV